MKRWWVRLKPKTLRHKIFVSFFLFVLVPLLYYQIRYEGALEDTFIENTGFQNNQQLNQIKMNLYDIRGFIFSNMISWERTESLRDHLLQRNDRMLRELLLARLEQTRTQAHLFGDFLQAGLYDENFRLVTASADDAGLPDTLEIRDRPLDSGGRWSTESSAASPQSTNLVYLYALQQDQRMFGYVRIEFHLERWMQSMGNTLGVLGNYAIIQDGAVLAETKPSWSVSAANIRKIVGGDIAPETSYLDRKQSLLLNYVYIPTMDWYVVCQFPMSLFLGDIEEQREAFLTATLLFALLFTVLMYVLLSRITRPLNMLRAKMNKVIEKEFKLQLKEDGLEGEVLALTQTFNQTVKDINELIKRLKEEERQKEAVQFQALMAQMNPHFLLNMLNTVKWLAMSRDDGDIAEICKHLGILLENGLQTSVELVHLKAELELVGVYIRLQQIRFRDRFTVHYDIDDEVEYALVPKFSLQPLVENAIQHGIAPLDRPGRIHVRVRRQHSKLLVQVEDDGIGLEQSARLPVYRKSRGIGLNNLRERFHLLFKLKDALQLRSLEQGTLVQFELPLLISEPYAQRKEGERHVESDRSRG